MEDPRLWNRGRTADQLFAFLVTVLCTSRVTGVKLLAFVVFSACSTSRIS